MKIQHKSVPMLVMLLISIRTCVPVRHCITALLIGLVVFLTPSPGRAVIAELEATPALAASALQGRTVQLIHSLASNSHYRKQKLDDEFSARILNTYIDRLDPGRGVFLQSDIDQFDTLRYSIDDYIRNGALSEPFDIFNVFRMRMDERVEFALARLRAPFDFNLDEFYELERDEAPWAANADELNELWRKRIKNDIINLRLTGKEDDETLDTLAHRYTHMARRTRQFDSKDVFQFFVNSYVNLLDPHTSYFSPRASENFQIQMRLSLTGIGAVLQTDDEHTQVRRVLPGGPADKGGELKADDRIIGVAQGDKEMVDVVGWRLDDVVELIRGPKASIVRLEILSGVDLPSRVISIQRDEISLDEQAAKKYTMHIKNRLGESTIGVIDLPSFYIDFAGQQQKLPDYRSTTRDVRKLLDEFRRERIDGLIIDLRGNGGGSLTEAVLLTGLFIRTGPVVQVQHSTGRVQVEQDTNPLIAYDGPLMVLVDRHSASASEIFAGAIQDYRRGLVIGEPTYGKGTVQHLVTLSNYAKNIGSGNLDIGQLKMTIAQFFRVSGDSTQHRGVVPDITWPTADDQPSGERSQENAIPWRRIKPADFAEVQSALIPKALRRVRDLHARRVESNAEFQYFLDVKKVNDERREKKEISLNEETRRQERDEWNRVRLELENRKRRALGRHVAASADALDKEREAESRAAEGNPDAWEADAHLRESGNMLNDFLFTMDALGPGGAIAGQGQAE